ncbi:MAG: M15 family metallopeptidase [Spirochaetales bacterium]|nr:M15 family metallopeptidase [Spirochaetales bacterium]
MRFFLILLISLITINISGNNIHPNFNLTKEDINEIMPELNNDEIYKFLTNIHMMMEENVNLILVDKNNRLSSDYIPANLINLGDYNLHTRYKTMLFESYALNDFVKMSEDAKKEGIDIFIASTYRSYEFQNQIFNNMKNYHGEEKAATIVAYPGASQHQLGTAVDFGSIKPSYAYTDAGIWLLKNGWKYGFTLSYPENMEEITTYMWEPWHYRYIGRYGAIIQKEYFNNVQQYLLEFWNKYKLFFEENHIH